MPFALQRAAKDSSFGQAVSSTGGDLLDTRENAHRHGDEALGRRRVPELAVVVSAPGHRSAIGQQGEAVSVPYPEGGRLAPLAW